MPDGIAPAALLLSLLATVGVILAYRRIRTLEGRLAQFLSGRDGRSLEATIASHEQSVAKHEKEIGGLVQASEYLHRALQSAVRKVSFERYNPFPGLGGNQSFTLVLLDAHNSGVVITSLHNRDATRLYAKAIRDGQPLQQLSEEEERSLKNAMLQKGA